ncbi:MAG: tetratricopeptide repeat protein [Anaerolineales bacterium]
MNKRRIDALPLGLAIIALAVSVFAVWRTETENDRRMVDPDRLLEQAEPGTVDGEPGITLPPDELQNLLDTILSVQQQAENAANSADVVLSFIEGGSILLGALIAIAVLAFGASIQDIRSQIDESVNDAETRLQASEQRMQELYGNIQAQIQTSIDQAQARLHASEDQMGELTQRIEKSIQETEEAVGGLHMIVDQAVESAKRDAEDAFRVLSLLLLAEQQVRARNRQTAIATLEEAHSIDPNNQTTNYLLGYLYVGRKNFDTAIRHLQMALDVDPNFPPALAAMGLAQRRIGDREKDDMQQRQYYASAELNLSKALSADASLIDADNESYFGTLGGLYRRQGRNQDALKAYESAVQVTPNNSYPVGNLATLYKKLGHEEQAQHMYERATEIAEAILDDNPGDTWARLDLAQALLVRGQKRKALEQYKNVIGRVSESSPLEVALNGLEFLTDAPTPIDGLGEAKTLLRAAIPDEDLNDDIRPTRI